MITTTTTEKALKLNLESKCYGTFAEIGAGQEVANAFFKAGGASGTIAKTLSAYDMKISDSYYGVTKRYVSKERLLNMLDFEYDRLVYNLSDTSNEKLFFSLASTIETINFSKTNQGQGWMGVKFQTDHSKEPNYCIIHFLMNDQDVSLQQELTGILGVNLLYGLYHFADEMTIVKHLCDNLQLDRLEVNYIEFLGKDFSHVDNRKMALELVNLGLSKMALFNSEKKILQPVNALYKSDVIIQRGRFRPPTKVNQDLFNQGVKHLIEEKNISPTNLHQIAEITLHNLKGSDDKASINDFLFRADLLCELGYNVLITDFTYHQELTDYINKCLKVNSLSLVMGKPSFEDIFNEGLSSKYDLLSTISSMTKGKNQLLIYPTQGQTSTNDFDKLSVDQDELKLIQYLISKAKISYLNTSDEDLLKIDAGKVYEMIKNTDECWESFVPNEIKVKIKESSHLLS